MVQKIEVLVEGGKASGGPPLGPAIGPMGLNINEVVAKINEATADFSGMKVPVTITADPSTRKYEIKVGTPPASSLLIKAADVQKGSGDSLRVKIGDVSMDQVRDIARLKFDSTLSKDLDGTVREVMGTAVSVGVTVDGKDPRELKNIKGNHS